MAIAPSFCRLRCSPGHPGVGCSRAIFLARVPLQYAALSPHLLVASRLPCLPWRPERSRSHGPALHQPGGQARPSTGRSSGDGASWRVITRGQQPASLAALPSGDVPLDPVLRARSLQLLVDGRPTARLRVQAPALSPAVDGAVHRATGGSDNRGDLRGRTTALLVQLDDLRRLRHRRLPLLSTRFQSLARAPLPKSGEDAGISRLRFASATSCCRGRLSPLAISPARFAMHAGQVMNRVLAANIGMSRSPQSATSISGPFR